MFKIKISYSVLKKYFGYYYHIKMANIRKDIHNCPFKATFYYEDDECTASKSVCRSIMKKICEVEFQNR